MKERPPPQTFELEANSFPPLPGSSVSDFCKCAALRLDLEMSFFLTGIIVNSCVDRRYIDIVLF